MRKYRTEKGIWGFGFSMSTYGWAIQFGPWVITNSVE